MNSSRMRSSTALAVSGRGCLPRGCLPNGCLPRAVSAQGGVHLPDPQVGTPSRGQTGACQKLRFVTRSYLFLLTDSFLDSFYPEEAPKGRTMLTRKCLLTS